jgi:hypothetical protein
VREVTLKATGLPLQSARYTVENPPELSGERFLIWSRGTSRAGAALGRRGLAFAPAEPEEGSGVAGMVAAGTEGGGGVWAWEEETGKEISLSRSRVAIKVWAMNSFKPPAISSSTVGSPSRRICRDSHPCRSRATRVSSMMRGGSSGKERKMRQTRSIGEVTSERSLQPELHVGFGEVAIDGRERRLLLHD